MTHFSSEESKEDRNFLLREFADSLDIPMTNLDLLNRALTHTSYANENKHQHIHHNERLEFLGDAILDLVIGEYLFLQFPQMPEGELTKARASVVCESALAECSVKFHIGQYLRLGRGEACSGGRDRSSILADAFEAVVGAIYIDSSYEAAASFILSHLKKRLDLVKSGDYGRDYKTLFQEFIQRDGEQPVIYNLYKEEGPDHDKTFFMEVWVNEQILGCGSGKSKKDAEQQAAQAALRDLHAL